MLLNLKEGTTQKGRIILMLILLITFITRMYYSTHCIWVDEARDLAVAKNIAEKLRIEHFGQPFTQHPFFYHIIIAVFMKLGMEKIAGAVTLSLFSTLLTLFTYLLGKEMYNQEVGLISAMLITFHPMIWFLSERILPDIPYVAMMTATAYYFIRWLKTNNTKMLYTTAILTGMSVFTKFPAVIMIPIFFITALLKKRHKLLINYKIYIGALLGIIAFSPYMIHSYLTTGTPFDIKEVIGWGTTPEGGVDVQSMTYYLFNILETLEKPLAIFSIMGFATMFLFKKKKVEAIFQIIWVITFFTAFSMFSVKVTRYLLPIISMLCIAGGLGIWKISKDFMAIDKIFKYAPYLLISAFLLFSIQPTISSITENAKGFCKLEEAGNWLEQHSSENDVIYAGSYVILHYYSNRNNITPYPKTQQEFESNLEEKNPKYLILDKWERTQPPWVFEYINNNRNIYKLVHYETIDNANAVEIYSKN